MKDDRLYLIHILESGLRIGVDLEEVWAITVDKLPRLLDQIRPLTAT